MGSTWSRVKGKCSPKKFVKRWKTYSRKKKIIVLSVSASVLLLAVGGAVFCLTRNAGQDMVAGGMVTEVSAQNGEISNTVVGTGNLEADTSNSMKIPSGLVIEEVLVESGDHVSAGDTLATVNAASVLSTLQSVQDSIADLDEEILEVQSGDEEEDITAGVSGRVKRIFASEGSDAADCILDNGALILLSADGKLAVKFDSAVAVTKGSSVTIKQADGTERTGSVESVSGESCTVTFSDTGIGVDETVTVAATDGTALGSGQAYIHQVIQVTAVGGTVSDICVAEDEAVDAGDTLLVLDSSAQSIRYQELTAERQAMTETLKKLLAISKTGTVTAEMDGTVEEVNVSGGTSSGSSTSGTQSSTATSPMSYTDSSESEEILTDGTAALMFLTAETGKDAETGNVDQTGNTDTTGNTDNTGNRDNAGNTGNIGNTDNTGNTDNAGNADNTGNTGNAGDTGNAGNADNTGNTDNTEAQTTTKLTLAVKGSGCGLAHTLIVEMPVMGQEPQKKISTVDGSYSGVISWSPQDSTFQAETVYKAGVTLYAGDSYHFEADSITSVETGLASGVSVSDDRKTLTFQMTFPMTEKEVQDNKGDGSQGDTDKTDGAGSTGSGTTGTSGNNGAAGSGTASGTSAGTGSGTGVANTGTGTSGSSSTAGTSTGSSTDSSEYSTDITAFGISSDENMVLAVSVDELDINSISRSQEAEVTLDAIEEETFTGTVTKVGNSASTSGGVTKYTVQITIPKDEQMKTGMNASATIVIEKKENVITVPVNALQERGGETFVYTEKSTDGTLSGEKTVTTGISDGDTVEITEGLSEGDTVYYQKTGNTGSASSDKSGGMPEGGDFDPSSGGKDMRPEGMPNGQSMPSRE